MKQKQPKKSCEVKSHFTCDGTGEMCETCGESSAACSCNENNLVVCEECDGAGQFCVTHEAPLGACLEK